MSKPMIHGFAQSTYVWTARAALAAKGTDHDFEGFAPPAHKGEEHLARHPFGKVPTLTHGDITLYECTAIVRYIDASFDGPGFYPEGALAQAQTEQWISVANSYAYPAFILKYVFSYIFPGTPDGSPHLARIEAAMPEVHKVLKVIDAGLADKSFLVNETFGAADLFMGPLLYCISGFGEGKAALGEYPNIQRYMGNLAKAPGFLSVAPSQG